MISKQGEHGMGTTELLALLGLFVMLALYGIWKHGKAEDTDYRRFVDKANQIESRMTTLEKHCLEENSQVFVNALTRVEQLEIKAVASFQRVDEVQDHCARLRDQMVELRDRSYPRKIEVTFPVKGAIPIELRGPTVVRPATKKKSITPARAKALLKKTSKQLRGLSK